MMDERYTANRLAVDMEELITAHDEVIALIREIPDAAIDWLPGGEDWSLRQILSHLAHSNDFYVMIVNEVRARNFGSLKLQLELPGFQRMTTTDAEITQCITLSAVLDCFEQAYQRMLAALQSTKLAELDQPFALSYAWQPDAEPETTTLRQRVIETGASHMREHRVQLIGTLARWQAAHDERGEDDRSE